MSDACPNCGHALADHVESGWGPHTLCVEKLDTFPDGGYWVCPCVLTGGVDEWRDETNALNQQEVNDG